MAESKRDANRVPTILGLSNADGVTPLSPYIDSVTNRLLVSVTGSVTVDDVNINAYSGATENTAVTLILANTAYTVPSTVDPLVAPAKQYLLVVTNTHTTAVVYWAWESTISNGTPLNPGKQLPIEMAANRTLYFYSATAGVVLSVNYVEIN
jgi:hypothetical protein